MDQHRGRSADDVPDGIDFWLIEAYCAAVSTTAEFSRASARPRLPSKPNGESFRANSQYPAAAAIRSRRPASRNDVYVQFVNFHLRSLPLLKREFRF